MEKYIFHREDTRLLIRAMLSLHSEEECERFLTDVCTLSEIEALAQRIEVARLLRDGKTYTYIEKATGASTATIGRVKRFLNHGADGYSLVLERLYGDTPTEE